MFTEKIELKRQVFIELKGSDEKRTLKSIFLDASPENIQTSSRLTIDPETRNKLENFLSF